MLSPVRDSRTQDMRADRRHDATAMIAMIALGVFSAYVFHLGVLTLLFLGIGFIVWGIAARCAGPMVPGGVLAGCGLGLVLTQGPLSFADGDIASGIFLCIFACGWASVPILSRMFTRRRVWWPLLPAAMMVLTGLILLF